MTCRSHIESTQRCSLHSNVMELGLGGTKLGPYWSMRWPPAGPSHLRTTVRRLGRSCSLRRTSDRSSHGDGTPPQRGGALHRRGGGIETATQWTADRICRAMGRPCADNGQRAPRFPRIGVGALVPAMGKAELESLNGALSGYSSLPLHGDLALGTCIHR